MDPKVCEEPDVNYYIIERVLKHGRSTKNGVSQRNEIPQQQNLTSLSKSPNSETFGTFRSQRSKSTSSGKVMKPSATSGLTHPASWKSA